MYRRNIYTRYFDWLCEQVNADCYRELAAYLHSVTFEYTISLDGNRADDGIDLRYRFGENQSIDDVIIAGTIDRRNPCSVFEMMVALAIRCEEHIMSDSDFGERTELWFKNMLKSLGVDYMTDGEFEPEVAEKIINRMLDRKYNRNGEGGLFTVNHRRADLRTAEIWDQMNWYLDELI